MLTENHAAGSFRATPCEPHDEIAFDHLMRADMNAPRNLEFRWSSGAKRPGRFVWTTVLALLINEEVTQALRQFTGWRPIPVRLLGKNEQVFGGYSLVTVTGRCGKFLERNSIRLHPAASGERYAERRGFCFEEDPVLSGDIMMPRIEATYIYVRQAVRELLSRWNASNLSLTSCEDVIVPEMLFEMIVEKEKAFWA